jgi:hypothetical protein
MYETCLSGCDSFFPEMKLANFDRVRVYPNWTYFQESCLHPWRPSSLDTDYTPNNPNYFFGLEHDQDLGEDCIVSLCIVIKLPYIYCKLQYVLLVYNRTEFSPVLRKFFKFCYSNPWVILISVSLPQFFLSFTNALFF